MYALRITLLTQILPFKHFPLNLEHCYLISRIQMLKQRGSMANLATMSCDEVRFLSQ